MWNLVLSIAAAFMLGALCVLAVEAYLVHVFYASKATRGDVSGASNSRLRDHLDTWRAIQKGEDGTFKVPPTESCEWLNLIVSFVFRFLRDTDAADEFFHKKIRIEFDELLATAAGKVIEDIRVREYRLGESLPVFSRVATLAVEADELCLAADVAYTGGFQVVMDADLVFGMGASLSVTVASLRGRTRIRFAATPRPHWSFAFVEDPEIEFKVESAFNGRQFPQLAALITNQFRRSIRKKHTLPAFKPRQLVPNVPPKGPPMTPSDVLRESCKRLALPFAHGGHGAHDGDPDYVLVDGNPLLSGVLRVRLGKLTGLPAPIPLPSRELRDKEREKDHSDRPFYVEMEAECAADAQSSGPAEGDRRIHSKLVSCADGHGHAVVRSEAFVGGTTAGEADADAEGSFVLGAESTALMFRVYSRGRTINAKEKDAKEKEAKESAAVHAAVPSASVPVAGAVLCARGEVFIEDVILEMTAGGNHAVHRRLYLEACGGKDVWGSRAAHDPPVTITALFSFEPRPPQPKAPVQQQQAARETVDVSDSTSLHGPLELPKLLDSRGGVRSAPASPVARRRMNASGSAKNVADAAKGGASKRDSVDSGSVSSAEWDEGGAGSDSQLPETASHGRLSIEETLSWHRFAIDKFSAPLPKCQYCGGKVWRMRAFQCQACKYICHQKCLAECVRNTVCPSAADFREQQAQFLQQQQASLRLAGQPAKECAPGQSGQPATPAHPSQTQEHRSRSASAKEATDDELRAAANAPNATRPRGLTDSIESLQLELDAESKRRDALSRMLQSTANRADAEAVRRQLTESLAECERRMQAIAVSMLRQIEDKE